MCALPGQSPQTGKQAKAHGPDIGRPPGVLTQDALLGMDTIQERRPSYRCQQDRTTIPLRTVKADVRQEISEVERMAHQPVGSRLCQAAQGWPYAEPPAQGEETG